MVNLGTILRFQFGDRSAIETVARSRAAFLTGILLVLLTTIPRNYDQTHLSEDPFRWVFASLLFSLISGTWMYVIAYLCGTYGGRRAAKSEGHTDVSGWRSFMGLFWMTSPIAWLYALPVERWFDSVGAAKANVTLLAIVSAWRVLLMTRCISVACRMPFFKSLAWVLAGASTEVVVVGVFGGYMTKGIMASMSGMRNSPEEDIMLDALGVAIGSSLWIFPAALLVGLLWGWRGPACPLPVRESGAPPLTGLAALGVIWILIAIGPQKELALVSGYEKRLAAGETRAALDILNRGTLEQLSRSRVLPPKPFEHSVFRELPAVISELRNSDAKWVREYFVGHLEIAVSHYRLRWSTEERWLEMGQVDRYEKVRENWEFFGPDSTGILKLLTGLNRIPEGKAWLEDNELLLEVWAAAAQNGETKPHNWADRDEQRAAWKEVLKLLEERGADSRPAPASE